MMVFLISGNGEPSLYIYLWILPEIQKEQKVFRKTLGKLTDVIGNNYKIKLLKRLSVDGSVGV